MSQSSLPTATSSASVADILERVLDKGVVIAGDIRVKLVDIELLTIQLRLVVCSIEKAKEIGLDWWNMSLKSEAKGPMDGIAEQAALMASRLERIEEKLASLDHLPETRDRAHEAAN